MNKNLEYVLANKWEFGSKNAREFADACTDYNSPAEVIDCLYQPHSRTSDRKEWNLSPGEWFWSMFHALEMWRDWGADGLAHLKPFREHVAALSTADVRRQLRDPAARRADCKQWGLTVAERYYVMVSVMHGA